MNALRGFLANGPLLPLLRRRTRTRNRVLLYHRVVDDGCEPEIRSLLGGAITRSAFAAQLDYLARHHTVVPLEDIVARRGEPAGLVALTFDDGYADNLWHALPALAAKGLPATVFVASGHVGAPYGAWWDRLARLVAANRGAPLQLDGGKVPKSFDADRPNRQSTACAAWLSHLDEAERDRALEPAPKSAEDRFLAAEELRHLDRAGFRVQAHTIGHPRLSSLDDEAARREIADCKLALESLTGGRIDFFAYPFGMRGDFTETHKQAVRDAGYRAGFAAYRGVLGAASDPMVIPRIATSQDFDRFRLRLARAYPQA
jgi:peptidoglycan/xylan/chitin deacetylase (PgdA/CDA1 family)